MADKKITDKEALSIAWNYFQLHAQQRLSGFNFFLISQAFLTNALVMTFQQQFRMHKIGILVGMLQLAVCFVFWKYDERNKFLTQHGEDALKELERRYSFISPAEPSPVQVFLSEDMDTGKLRDSQRAAPVWSRQLSHSTCLNCIFVMFATVGITGAIISGFCEFAQPVPAPVQPPAAAAPQARPHRSGHAAGRPATSHVKETNKNAEKMVPPRLENTGKKNDGRSATSRSFTRSPAVPQVSPPPR